VTLLRFGANRRQLLALTAAWVSAGVWRRAHAALTSFLVPASLKDELATALKTGEPLVLMVSLDGCPFCKIARENYLAPLVMEQGLSVVQINMLRKERVTDVRGAIKTHEQLIAELNIHIAPTLIFYGHHGLEVAERLVGMGSTDFYGAYLDRRLEIARKAVRGR
jgi:thioredoxin-related protein